MAKATVIVTGDKELDAKLRTLEAKLQKKFIRKALRTSGKRVLDKFKTIVRAEAHDTGAYMRAASIRAMKRKRNKLGVQIHIDRNKLFAIRQKAKSKGEGLRKTSDIIVVHGKEFDEKFYYPASLEFGYTRKDGTRVEGVRAQRRALYENKEQTVNDFVADMKELVREA